MKQDEHLAASWNITRVTLSVLGTQLRNWDRYKGVDVGQSEKRMVYNYDGCVWST